MRYVHRHPYLTVWAVCFAQTVLGLLWVTFPPGQPGDTLKLIAFVAILAASGLLARRGLLRFAGDADVWRENSEGLGLWELNAWIWLNNSNGIFAFKNPRVPGDED